MSNNKAFTFIELLLAVGMFGVVSLTLFVTFSNGLKLEKEAQKVESVFRDAGWVLNTLERDLQNMILYYPPQRSEEVFISFKGEKDVCSMILPSDKGLQQVIYFLKEPDFDHIHKVIVGKVSLPQEIVVDSEEKRTTKFLVRERRPFPFLRVDPDEQDQTEVEILSRFVYEDSLAFKYAKTQKAGDLQWQETWEERYPPAALRIRMKLIEDSEEDAVTMEREMLIPLGMWGKKEF